MTCPTCGAPVSDQVRHCPNCGTPVEHPAPDPAPAGGAWQAPGLPPQPPSAGGWPTPSAAGTAYGDGPSWGGGSGGASGPLQSGPLAQSHGGGGYPPPQGGGEPPPLGEGGGGGWGAPGAGGWSTPSAGGPGAPGAGGWSAPGGGGSWAPPGGGWSPGGGQGYSPYPEGGNEMAGRGQLAGWWRRVGASLIDGILLALMGAIFLAVAGRVGEYVLGFAAGLAYTTALLVSRGQTVGMMAVGTKCVQQANGQNLEVGPAIGRYVIAELLGITVIGGILDIFWPLWDSNNQTIHDKVVKSLVVMA